MSLQAVRLLQALGDWEKGTEGAKLHCATARRNGAPYLGQVLVGQESAGGGGDERRLGKARQLCHRCAQHCSQESHPACCAPQVTLHAGAKGSSSAYRCCRAAERCEEGEWHLLCLDTMSGPLGQGGLSLPNRTFLALSTMIMLPPCWLLTMNWQPVPWPDV